MAKIRISLKTKVKGYSKKKGKGCFSIKVGDVKLTEAHRNKLDGLIDGAEDINLIIELEEEKLPYKD